MGHGVYGWTNRFKKGKRKKQKKKSEEIKTLNRTDRLCFAATVSNALVPQNDNTDEDQKVYADKSYVYG